jgi:hypothetical protein
VVTFAPQELDFTGERWHRSEKLLCRPHFGGTTSWFSRKKRKVSPFSERILSRVYTRIIVVYSYTLGIFAPSKKIPRE